MPKKLFTTEPAVFFAELFKEFLTEDREFLIKTPDPVVPSFAAELINQHYPAQTQLPLD